MRRPGSTRLGLPGAIVLIAMASAGCSGASSSHEVLLVSAAASLTDAFADIASAFQKASPGVEVTLNLGGSPALREQIIAGAPADVFASANASNMDQLEQAGALAGRSSVFARNYLEIAVPTGNPGDVQSLQAFADPDLLIGLCAPEVPCGEFADQILAKAGVVASVDTYEPDVRALLTKIEEGELDAGIVYRTDVASTRDTIEAVEIPVELNVVAGYHIAVLADAPHPDIAERFVAFVLSAPGREILSRYGFSVS
ncbi:MAG: molybdate ABC transporter substrate-binding protein [Acidimicrobiia bacterium]